MRIKIYINVGLEAKRPFLLTLFKACLLQIPAVSLSSPSPQTHFGIWPPHTYWSSHEAPPPHFRCTFPNCKSLHPLSGPLLRFCIHNVSMYEKLIAGELYYNPLIKH
jgi:hypothetical protein